MFRSRAGKYKYAKDFFVTTFLLVNQISKLSKINAESFIFVLKQFPLYLQQKLKQYRSSIKSPEQEYHYRELCKE